MSRAIDSTKVRVQILFDPNNSTYCGSPQIFLQNTKLIPLKSEIFQFSNPEKPVNYYETDDEGFVTFQKTEGFIIIRPVNSDIPPLFIDVPDATFTRYPINISFKNALKRLYIVPVDDLNSIQLDSNLIFLNENCNFLYPLIEVPNNDAGKLLINQTSTLENSWQSRKTTYLSLLQKTEQLINQNPSKFPKSHPLFAQLQFLLSFNIPTKIAPEITLLQGPEAPNQEGKTSYYGSQIATNYANANSLIRNFSNILVNLRTKVQTEISKPRTIKCSKKGSKTITITGSNPKCPKGYLSK